MTPYADETYGNAYFADRLATDAWDSAISADRVKALKQATRAIDRLPFAGDRADSAQENQFPRGDDVDVPADVMQACCELALAFLDGVDANIEAENLGNSNQGIGESRVTRDTSWVQAHFRAGIPSIQAWNLLKPYMFDANNGEVSRG